MASQDQIINRIRNQMARGQLVLFTGAGFSYGAKNPRGELVPSAGELTTALLQIAFPGEPADPDATLGEAYAAALQKKKSAVKELVDSRLTIDPNSIPPHLVAYFSLPWYRIYTLNIDDLDAALARRHLHRRAIATISATADIAEPRPRRPGGGQLQVIHLNGVVSQDPEELTFSELQYGERGAGPDTWFTRCVADLRSRPVVFVGTTLRESTLWQHLELRRRQLRASDVLPPGSLLVSPSLGRARAEMLASLNIDWYQGTAESFEHEVLQRLEDAPIKGFSFLETYDADYGRGGLPLVRDLANERPRLDTDYLMGSEPQWADLLQGRAAPRSSDGQLLAAAQEILNHAHGSAALCVTGTAGTGKSTALMRLGLALDAAGVTTFWIDRESAVTPAAVRQRLAPLDEKVAVLIDDADLFGLQLASLIRDLVPSRPNLLFVVGLRANRVDWVAEAIERSKDVRLVEFTVPPLEDRDIEALVAVLDQFNRLGLLKGKPAADRHAAFAYKCGRQLLVAMFEATTGERFEEKAVDEFKELTGVARFVYSLICIAGSQRQYLTRDEIVLACPDNLGDPIDAVQRLVQRHVIGTIPPFNHYRPRHRMISDVVFNSLREQGQLADPIQSLARAIASKFDAASVDRSDRVSRFLARLINHGFLNEHLRLSDARRVYEELENLLSDDYHFWLQRGSLEVEGGNLRSAEHFLNQARSMVGNDFKVDTEYGYLLMRKAVENHTELDAPNWFREGSQLLEGVISLRGQNDSYPYHVLGSQGIAWTTRTAKTPDETRRLLSYFLNVVEQGLKKHPNERGLKQLGEDIRFRMLSTTIPPRG